MNKDKIITDIYLNDSIIKYCKTISNEWEELKSQLIIQLIKMKEDKLFIAKEKGYLEYLCFTICKRIVYGNVSGTGIFYKNSRTVSLEEGYGSDIEVEEVECDRLDIIESILMTKHWYEKTLFNGNIVSDITGLKGKELGVFMASIKDKVDIYRNVREQILELYK